MKRHIWLIAITCCLAFPTMASAAKTIVHVKADTPIFRIVRVAAKAPVFRIVVVRENGKIKEDCRYKQGLKDGLCTKFHENGRKQEQQTFKAGKRDGNQSEWDSQGRLKFQAQWKDGRTHGVVREVAQNGKSKMSYCWNHKCSDQNVFAMRKQCNQRKQTAKSLAACSEWANFLFSVGEKPFTFFTVQDFQVAVSYHSKVIALGTVRNSSKTHMRIVQKSKAALKSLCVVGIANRSHCNIWNHKFARR